jgi:hypothetical protein
VPRIFEFYSGICLITKEKARKNVGQDKKNLSQVKKNLSHTTIYVLPHITKNTQIDTCPNKINFIYYIELHVSVYLRASSGSRLVFNTY